MLALREYSEDVQKNETLGTLLTVYDLMNRAGFLSKRSNLLLSDTTGKQYSALWPRREMKIEIFRYTAFVHMHFIYVFHFLGSRSPERFLSLTIQWKRSWRQWFEGKAGLSSRVNVAPCRSKRVRMLRLISDLLKRFPSPNFLAMRGAYGLRETK